MEGETFKLIEGWVCRWDWFWMEGEGFEYVNGLGYLDVFGMEIRRFPRDLWFVWF